jgi:class 3 adenylate cyclase
MNCPLCDASLPDDAGFCGQCGAAVRAERTCAQCGRTNPADMRFCLGCGRALSAAGEAPQPDLRSYTPRHLADKILQSRSALEGERKQVTVLFADVKGSMELAEQVDPEEWYKILDKFFQILTDGVHRFEGTVNQYTGDGIMALFGAPIAHEDHAQRACYAALHLRDELKRYANELRVSHGLSFFARMGLNSGEVVVGTIGDDLRMDYTAQGHVVGLAQRMEQLAEPGRACLTGETARLVGGYFQLAPLGPVRVKGVGAPVEVFELEGTGTLRTRLDVSRARGFTRFVGRDSEMRLLDTALERALGAEAQIVGVVGEAGVGKSRLCAEFIERCRARGVAVYEAHCLSHGDALPFLPVLQLFRAYFGIREHDPPTEARRRIAGTLLLLDERFREVLPLVFDFLGVPDPERPPPHMDPEVRQRQLLAFTAELLRARSAREAAVLLLDDLHWIDRSSDAIVGQLIPSSGRTRTLFLLNFRPEDHADWMTRPDYQQVALRPLGPEATAELVRELLGSDPSLAPLTTRLHERAGGNPFFAEELVRSLAEAGTLTGTPGNYTLRGDAERVAIPATVQSLLAARIDRLPENDKEALEAAAVIGKEFAEPLLRAVIAASSRGAAIGAELPPILDRLARAELIVERALYPEAEYAFRHPLVQEVAYHNQLGERRARTHARVAQALEQQYAASLDEHAPLLAHHREAAGETLAALRWHARAGAWFASRDLVQSFGHHQRVRALVPHVPESTETLTLGARACASILQIGWRGALPFDEYPAVLAEGRDWAERSGDPGLLARVLDAQATLLVVTTGSLAEPRALIEQAMALAERSTDSSLRVSIHQRIGWFLWLGADCDAVLAHFERGIALAGGDVRLGVDVVGFSSPIWMMEFRALALVSLGRLADAAEGVAQAERLAGELGIGNPGLEAGAS